MTKGTKRERECRDLYASCGWMAWRPKSGTNPYAGDPDVFEEFDVLAINPQTGELHGVQCKSNGARGLRSFSRRVWPYRAAGIRTMYAVPYDNEGWRVIDVCGPSERVDVVDERDSTMNMGDGVKAWLRGEPV